MSTQHEKNNTHPRQASEGSGENKIKKGKVFSVWWPILAAVLVTALLLWKHLENAEEEKQFIERLIQVFRYHNRLLLYAALIALIPAIVAWVCKRSVFIWWVITFIVVLTAGIASVYVPAIEPFIKDTPEYLSQYLWAAFVLDAIIIILIRLFLMEHVTYTKKKKKEKAKKEKAKKKIVICIDGTWNYPGQLENGVLVNTNVYRIWDYLEGEQVSNKERGAANRAKRAKGEMQEIQEAYYYNGVGNRMEHTNLGIIVGGAFGLGAERLCRRIYADLARVYCEGAEIHIFGFSRGAAIARMLAARVCIDGIPESLWTIRLLGHTFHFGFSKTKKESDVKVLGVWDTVAAFGIPRDLFGIPFQKINLFKNLTVDRNVKQVYHMVSIDEDRDAFEPTLIDPDTKFPERIIEIWFPGYHSDVGGGYATQGLSDITLDFIIKKVKKKAGLKFQEGKINDEKIINPNRPNTIIHRREKSIAYKCQPREIPLDACLHESVFKHMGNNIPRYCPPNVLKMLRKLKRHKVNLKKLAIPGVNCKAFKIRIKHENKSDKVIEEWTEIQKYIEYITGIRIWEDTEDDSRPIPVEEIQKNIAKENNG